MNTIQIISIIIEAAIALLALMATLQGKKYMCGLVITFAIYVYYDLARLYDWNVSNDVLVISFFIATVAALYSVVSIYRSKVKK